MTVMVVHGTPHVTSTAAVITRCPPMIMTLAPTASTIQRRSTTHASWCKDSSGSLAIVRDADENRALTELVAVDGSWIGLHGGSGCWQWVNGSNTVFHGDEFAVHPEGGVRDDDCVLADRRGESHNWVVEDCSRVHPFVCAYDHAETCQSSFPSTAVAQGSVQIPIKPIAPTQCPDISLVSTRTCRNFSDAIETADLLCKQTGANYSDADRICCPGKADPNNPKRKGEATGMSSRMIAVITGGIAVFVIVVILLITVLQRCQKRGDSLGGAFWQNHAKTKSKRDGGRGPGRAHPAAPRDRSSTEKAVNRARIPHTGPLGSSTDNRENATDGYDSSLMETYAPGIAVAQIEDIYFPTVSRLSNDSQPTTDFMD